MANTIFEQTGGTYTMQGDYCLPNLTLPPEEERPIGVWAHCRRQYPVSYTHLTLPTKLEV